jgi:hypothetical protein
VRWISIAAFEENLRGAYGGGEGANGSEGRTRQGGGYEWLIAGGTRTGRRGRAR